MLKNSFNFKFRNRSKSREKDAKYIPAAIIPSAAFVANPTLPTNSSMDESSNKLLNSTLNSSLVGLSAEFRKHQVDKSDEFNGEFENESPPRDNSVERRSTGSVNEDGNSPEIHQKKTKRKKKKEDKSELDNDSKRHINIANGLFEKRHSSSKSRSNKHPAEDISIHNIESSSQLGSSRSLYNMEDNVSAKNVHFPSQKLEADYLDFHYDGRTANDLSVISDGSGRKDENSVEENYKNSGFPVKVERYDDDNDVYDSSTVDKSSKVMLPVPPQFKDSSLSFKEVSANAIFSEPDHSVLKSPPKPEGDERSVRQLKDEIRVLQDMNYRLNVEISRLLPENDPGRFIGKSVFPGKGPAPNWIMNTKYLTPLLAAYDLKFQRQNSKIETMKEEILKFEKEIRLVLNENQELHSRLQVNGKNGISNNREWHVIAKQTKLVIEENKLLLQELDIQQQRTEEVEKKYMKEVEELRNLIAKTKSENNISIVEMESKVEEERDTEYKETSSTFIRKDAFQAEINILHSKIEDLLKNKGSLETEVDFLRHSDKKMKKKIEKLKATLQSEKEFHKYLGDVIDKSNEIGNERDRLVEMLEFRDNEIRRMSTKLKNQIKYNLDLGIDVDMNKPMSGGKVNDESIEELFALESWMTLLVQSVEDLSSRCRHQEKDVHYYQSLVKEKDKVLQEYEKENEDLETKLDLVWRNATKDSLH